MCLAIPGRVTEILDPEGPTAQVEIGGITREVNLACVVEGAPTDLVGEWVLVHVGFAIARLDPEEARRTLALVADLEREAP